MTTTDAATPAVHRTYVLIAGAVGLVSALTGVVLALVPHHSGTLDCGSVLNPSTGHGWAGDEVCAKALQSPTTTAWVIGGIGVLVLIVAIYLWFYPPKPRAVAEPIAAAPSPAADQSIAPLVYRSGVAFIASAVLVAAGLMLGEPEPFSLLAGIATIASLCWGWQAAHRAAVVLDRLSKQLP